MRHVLLAAAAVLATAVPANAATITGLYNTGVDNNGNVLAVGATDTHYLFNMGAGKATGAPFVYTNGAYGATTPTTAAYISAQDGGGFTTATNSYSLSFNLAGFDPATAQISGRFAADDRAEIFLNGVSTGVVANGFTAFTTFNITTGFVAGANTLLFRLTDVAGPPSALVVDRLAGTVQAATTPVPELATWGMMIAGFGLIGAAARRRRVAIRFA